MVKDFVLEIGTEELPALDLYPAAEELKEKAQLALKELRLNFEELRVLYTPRRIALCVKGLADKTEALEQCLRGPAASIAFDAQGKPTKAAEGFARGKGLAVEDLFIQEEEGKDYVFCTISKPSQDAAEHLAPLMSKLIGEISWPRSQRWGSGAERFARPVRWLLALLDDQVIDVSFGDIKASNETQGHRLICPGGCQISSASNYEDELLSCKVIVDQDKRAQKIKEGISQIEKQTGCKADIPVSTFKEVVNLVEWPTAMLAHFDEEFLQIPKEIITDAMLEHQRYFPLYDKDQKLSNGFIVTSNGKPECEKIIVDGNERVVRARLSDAAFFYFEDSKRPLDSYFPQLEKIVFQDKLGSVAQKAQRMSELAAYMAGIAESSEDVAKLAQRAALLAKCDLVTNAVVEFTSLQGVMGSYYAALSGEDPEVCTAIAEHYKPRFADDELPSTFVARLCALADKLNTIAGIFALGQAPSGSSDPYAIRRSALGVISILLEEPAISLDKSLAYALKQYETQLDFDYDAVLKQLRDFFRTRMEVRAKEMSFAHDSVAAVSAAAQKILLRPHDFFARLAALEEARKQAPELFVDLGVAFSRARNLTDTSLGCDYDASLFVEAENELAQALHEVQLKLDAALAKQAYKEAMDALASLRQPIDSFFEEVFVADPDQKIRENRFKLLNSFVEVFLKLADVGQLVK